MSEATQENLPELRFPEFSGAWEFSRLSKRVTKVGSGVTPRGGADVYQTEGIPLLRSQNVRDSVLDLTDVAYISEIINAGMSGSAVHPNDVLLNITGASIGRSCVVPSDFGVANVNQHVCIIRLNEKNSPYFLQSFLASYKGQKLIFQSQCGGGREGLNFENIKAFKTIFPLLPEQKKIASFLSAVDEKIEQITRKKDLLEQYKKGMMQKLFSQEIRFKDDNGKPFPDWEEKRLGGLYEFKSTNSFSRDQLNYDGGEVFNIHYGDIHKRFKPRFELLHEDVPFVNSDVFLGGISEDKYCKEGDLVIADASEDYDDIGKTIELKNLNGKKVLAGLHTLLARLSSDDIYVGFGAYLMASKSVRKQIKLIAQGTKVLGISAGRMNKIKLSIPSSNEEQKKNANFLSSVDKKIDLIATQITQAQDFKKGLLQQMFV